VGAAGFTFITTEGHFGSVRSELLYADQHSGACKGKCKVPRAPGLRLRPGARCWAELLRGLARGLWVWVHEIQQATSLSHLSRARVCVFLLKYVTGLMVYSVYLARWGWGVFIPHPSRTNFGLRLVYRVGLGLVFIFV